MYLQKLILIRSGEAKNGDKKDAKSTSNDELKSKRSSLSHIGRLQIAESKIKIWPHIKEMHHVEIYSSNSTSAKESSELLETLFKASAKPIRDLKEDERLYSHIGIEYDLKWIKEEMESSTADAIIMVGAVDLVCWLPEDLGFRKINAGPGEGACMEMKTWVIEEIVFDENYWQKAFR